MNFALNQNYIPSFDSRLSTNFNHLLFADDLIIVTQASRAAARHCMLCLGYYSSLIGQCPNPSKYGVYFPSSLNRRVALSIKNILGMNSGNYPYKYLGVQISPCNILDNQYQFMIDRMVNTVKSCNHSFFSYAGKIVLINSSLLSIPNYLMSSGAIPDTVLDKFSKIARDFLWSKGGNRSGVHSIA